jgi:hypothetical protein
MPLGPSGADTFWWVLCLDLWITCGLQPGRGSGIAASNGIEFKRNAPSATSLIKP